MEKFNEYEKKCMMIAEMWSYKFNTTMTQEDLKLFREDCKNAEVDIFDVYEFMDDYNY